MNTSNRGKWEWQGSWGRCLAFSVLLLAGAASQGAPGEPPSVDTVLELAGMAPGSVAVLLTWQEAAPETGEMVFGLRLSSVDGGEPFDFYYDASGAALDEPALDSLGISGKDWSPAPVTRQSERVAPRKRQPETPPRVETAFRGLSLPERAAPAVDVAQALWEDETGHKGLHKGVARIGLTNPLVAPVVVTPVDATDGWWQRPAGGEKLWSLSLSSAGALGMRVHFAALKLPDAARVVVFNPDDPGEAHRIPAGGDTWSPTFFGDRAGIEVWIPGDTAPDALYLEIDAVTHHYRAMEPLLKQAGACHNDATCSEAWADTARGVAGVGSVTTSGVLFCTGSLLTDANPGFIPYFLTADHCLVPLGGTGASPLAANSMEFYWLFQSSECNGAPPEASQVPRTTGGADLLTSSYGETGTDVALLRLREDPPADQGLTYLGYSTEPAAVGTNVVCIHHPSGTYKRITFGSITDEGSPSFGDRYYPIDRYHETIWNDGTTEPGSSGSPLFQRNTQLIVGQLFGGAASCDFPDEPDYYGRFDVSYPLLRPWLTNADAAPGTFELTVRVTGLGLASVDRAQQVAQGETFQISLTEGTEILLQARPIGEGAFQSWSGDAAGSSPNLTVTMDSDKTITANFSETKTALLGCKAARGAVGTDGADWAVVCLCLACLLLSRRKPRQLVARVKKD